MSKNFEKPGMRQVSSTQNPRQWALPTAVVAFADFKSLNRGTVGIPDFCMTCEKKTDDCAASQQPVLTAAASEAIDDFRAVPKEEVPAVLGTVVISTLRQEAKIGLVAAQCAVNVEFGQEVLSVPTDL